MTMATTSDNITLVEQYCAQNYSPLPIVLTEGEGVYVRDENGKQYIDMLSAYSALNHGHRHPAIIAAIKSQLDRLTITSRAFHNDLLGPFLKRLCEITTFEKALPMNTGAEAVETALKAMRKWAYEVKGVQPGKARIIAAANNFHGRTITIISMSTSNTARNGFAPFTPCIDIVPFGDAAALAAAITPDTAGFIVEPIQGEGGVIVPPQGYLRDIRRICTENNILLCLDEIQTGLGRTGRTFCFQHEDIRPDILTIGKALGGGVYPVSAVCADNFILDLFTPGCHGSTFGGNPLAAAAALAALDTLIAENLPARSAELGDYFTQRLHAMRIAGLREIRGKGLFVGIEFTNPVAHRKALDLMHAGILAKDTHDVTLRFAPPLIITRGQLDTALDIIATVLA